MPRLKTINSKQWFDCIELCNAAQELVKRCGFELRYASSRSEACYYGWPGHRGVIRVAAHKHRGPWIGLPPVVTTLTFRSDNGHGQCKITPQKFYNEVARAIGMYFLKECSGTTCSLEVFKELDLSPIWPSPTEGAAEWPATSPEN